MKIRSASAGRLCSVREFDGICGKPAVVEFDSRSGDVYAECAEHALPSDLAALAAAERRDAPADYRLPSGNKSASRAAYFLVDRFDVIRGYAESDGPLVAKRAYRLGARIVRNPRFVR